MKHIAQQITHPTGVVSSSVVSLRTTVFGGYPTADTCSTPHVFSIPSTMRPLSTL